MANTPHDALFKAIFARPRQAAEMLRLAFSPELVRLIDFTTLKKEPGSFIDEAMAEHHTDLLFSVRVAGRDVKIYVVFEHQSTVDARMPLRLLDYMMCIWKAAPPGRPLPVVLPVVLHHSDTGWLSATAFESLFGPEVPLALLEFTPRFRFMLDDLSAEDDDVLMHRAVSSTTLLVLAALKHARSAASLARFAHDWTRLVREILREPDGVRALKLVFRYLASVRGPQEIPLLEQIAAPATDEAKMQTIAEFYEQRGEQRGEQKALLRVLRGRFGVLPDAALERIAAADEVLLERWLDRLLGARSLDEIFAD